MKVESILRLSVSLIALLSLAPSKVPWSSSLGIDIGLSGATRDKNLRHKFYKRYLESGNDADLGRYKLHNREFEFFKKFLYNQYMSDIVSKLRTNPKSFWHFVNSKRKTSNIPSRMSLDSEMASSDLDLTVILLLLVWITRKQIDYDGLSPFILKNLYRCPLKIIFNKSLSSGTFIGGN